MLSSSELENGKHYIHIIQPEHLNIPWLHSPKKEIIFLHKEEIFFIVTFLMIMRLILIKKIVYTVFLCK